MMKERLKEGEEAPDFILRNQHGETIRLHDFRGKNAVVLYFYPKDDTPGCTAQACSFRDQHQDFKDLEAVILGVSSCDISSHKNFAEKYELPFSILSDHRGELRKTYGATNIMGLIPGRITYVIDRKGIVKHVFNSMFSPEQHIDESLRVLKTL